MKKILAVLCLAATALGCGTAPKLTESEEYYVGRGVAAGAIVKSPVHEDPALEEYVANVGYTVALESDRPETFKGYTFGVLRSDGINAFAAPGGMIFVTTAAIQHMQSEDELAGVLAHEIAHVNLKHPEMAAQRASQKAGFFNVVSGGMGLLSNFVPGGGQQKNLAKKLSKVLSAVLDKIGEAILSGYSREDELAADALAVDLVTREGAGYDPHALRDFISRLPQKDKGAWATHPELEGRVKAVEEKIKEHEPVPTVHEIRTKRFQAMTAGLRGQ